MATAAAKKDSAEPILGHCSRLSVEEKPKWTPEYVGGVKDRENWNLNIKLVKLRESQGPQKIGSKLPRYIIATAA